MTRVRSVFLISLPLTCLVFCLARTIPIFSASVLARDWGKKDDEAECLWFVGRKDDLIISAGYRNRPEIEASLIRHKSVAMTAVIGSPDPE
jgi:acyl-coenzyme A synthetase/AMP-(fatty) acid ligase